MIRHITLVTGSPKSEEEEKMLLKYLKSVIWALNYFTGLRQQYQKWGYLESGGCVSGELVRQGILAWVGSSGLGLERRPGREGHLTLPRGSSPEQLGLSGKLSEEGAGQDPNLSRQFRPNRQLPYKGKNRSCFFFSLYFKLSVSHASFGLKCVGLFFFFQVPLPSSVPELFTHCTPATTTPSSPRPPPPPADVCCCWGHSINNNCPLAFPTASCACLWWMAFQASRSWGPHLPFVRVWGGVGVCVCGGAGLRYTRQVTGLYLKTDFSLAPLVSPPRAFCIFPKCGMSLPSAGLEQSLVPGGQTCPASGRHSLSFRAVFIFGCREVLNGPDTGLGDWWPYSTLSPQGPGLWSSYWWEVKRLFALLKCLGISSV